MIKFIQKQVIIFMHKTVKFLQKIKPKNSWRHNKLARINPYK